MILIDKISIRLFKSDIKELYDYMVENDMHIIDIDIKDSKPDSIEYIMGDTVTLHNSSETNLPF